LLDEEKGELLVLYSAGGRDMQNSRCQTQTLFNLLPAPRAVVKTTVYQNGLGTNKTKVETGRVVSRSLHDYATTGLRKWSLDKLVNWTDTM